jgi:methionine-rich copper-binding protein CopC
MRNIFAAVVAIALSLHAATASAHAFLKTAEPAVGSTVRQAPNDVVITFTEGVEPAFSTIAVQDASGADVTDGAVRLAGDSTHLAVPLKPLQPGAYRVIWHATAVDTHKTQGTFSFNVTP